VLEDPIANVPSSRCARAVEVNTNRSATIFFIGYLLSLHNTVRITEEMDVRGSWLFR
jgi:hypothetical protein